MPKQGKSPKKKTKEKSPQRTEESEYPEMDQDVYNRLLQNAIEHSKAELQQQTHSDELNRALGMIRPYWCPGNYNVADFFSKLLEKGLFTMHAHRFGMNFEETIVGKLTEVYQTVHLKEFTDFPKKDEKDPTTVFTDIHFEKKSVAYEAYHLSHGFCQ